MDGVITLGLEYTLYGRKKKKEFYIVMTIEKKPLEWY